MRVSRNYIIGGLIVLSFFLLGIIHGVWPTEDRVKELQALIDAKAHEYASVASARMQEANHCAMAEVQGQQLLLLHGEAERLREQKSLVLSQLGKGVGAQ